MKKVLFLFLATMTIVSACTAGRIAVGKPQVVINSPSAGTKVKVGQSVNISVTASDGKGVSHLALEVDGKPLGTAKAPGGKSAKLLPVVFKWAPAAPGVHVITVKAYNTSGVESDPAIVQLTVESGAPTRQPSPTGTASKPTVPKPTIPKPTAAAPTSQPTKSPTDTPVETRPYVVSSVSLNVRSGPGTSYPVIGRLAPGQKALVEGKNADGSWWQIEFPPETGSYGWVSAYYVTPHNTGAVAVVSTPPPPPTPTPTETPKPTAQPTATPGSVGQASISFSADSTNINAGDCTFLRWAVDNVAAVYLDGAGVTGHGNKKVCPGSTTTYTLHVVKQNNSSEDRQVTITVTGAPQPVTVELHTIPNEDGHLVSDGSIGMYPFAGSFNGKKMDAYLSFDISSIPAGAHIQSASLDLSNALLDNDPFGSLGWMRVYHHEYGTLDSSDFVDGFPTGSLQTYSSKPSGPFSNQGLVSAIQGRLGHSRFQVRFQFQYVGGTHRYELQDATLKITYTP